MLKHLSLSPPSYYLYFIAVIFIYIIILNVRFDKTKLYLQVNNSHAPPNNYFRAATIHNIFPKDPHKTSERFPFGPIKYVDM